MDNADPRSAEIDEAIVQMITIDDQPFSVVENPPDGENDEEFVTVEWRKDALDLMESPENFRHTFERNKLSIRPSLYEDSGLYECTKHNQILVNVASYSTKRSATIEVYPLYECFFEAFFCMVVLSFSGFFPFLAIVFVRSFFANQMASFDEQERLEIQRKRKAFEIDQMCKVNCSFYFKIGACRHGDKCSRMHNVPTFSQYKDPINYTDADDQSDFDDFFEAVFCELEDQYGEVEEMNVCDNMGEHMIGNVYVKFKYEEDAERACRFVNNRWFNGEPIHAELSPVTDFREACCRQYEMG
uniref:Uncharacterized protein n=1 Tax=Romanomermis culicivorax TaxID=13658 RepID=A0A915HFX3_ROMCU